MIQKIRERLQDIYAWVLFPFVMAFNTYVTWQLGRETRRSKKCAVCGTWKDTLTCYYRVHKPIYGNTHAVTYRCPEHREVGIFFFVE